MALNHKEIKAEIAGAMEQLAQKQADLETFTQKIAAYFPQVVDCLEMERYYKKMGLDESSIARLYHFNTIKFIGHLLSPEHSRSFFASGCELSLKPHTEKKLSFTLQINGKDHKEWFREENIKIRSKGIKR